MIYAFVRFCRFKWCLFWLFWLIQLTGERWRHWFSRFRVAFSRVEPWTSGMCSWSPSHLLQSQPPVPAATGACWCFNTVPARRWQCRLDLNGCLKVIVQMAPLRFHRTTDVLHPVGPAAGVVPRGNVTQTVDADALTPRTARSWVKTEIVVAGMVRGAIGQARSAWMLKPMGSQQPSLHFLKTMSLWTLDIVEAL